MVVSFSAIRGFVLRVLVIALVIGVPAAIVTFMVSGRSTPLYLADATLLIPLAQGPIDLPGEVPAAVEPMMAAAYGPVLKSRTVLEDAYARLAGPDAPPPTARELAAFRDSIRFQFEERKRSTLIFVDVEGPSPAAAIDRANALAAALVAWDDARALADANRGVEVVESQIEAIEAELVRLRSSGSRANLPQIANLSVVAANLRQQAAVARAAAVSSRGNLEFLVPASRSFLIEPSPVVDAAVVLALVTVMAMVVLLVRAGLNRRVNGVAGLAEVTGLPVLADLTGGATGRAAATRPARFGPGRPDGRELSYLKAHLDRMLMGGEVLVAGLTDNTAAARVATALDTLFSAPGSTTTVTVGPWLLGSGDALERATEADAVLIVADPKETIRADLRRAVQWLGRSSANVMGIVAASARSAR